LVLVSLPPEDRESGIVSRRPPPLKRRADKPPLLKTKPDRTIEPALIVVMG
jgi:hypothetical protein